jgi:hypothetical protein
VHTTSLVSQAPGPSLTAKQHANIKPLPQWLLLAPCRQGSSAAVAKLGIRQPPALEPAKLLHLVIKALGIPLRPRPSATPTWDVSRAPYFPLCARNPDKR